jgi:hypothetical protein
MVAVLTSQSAHATTKRIESCQAGVTRASTGLRRYVRSELVGAGALSGRGRALVRNRIEAPTFDKCFAWRRPPRCGWKRRGRDPVAARMPRSPFRTGGSDLCAEHRPPRPRDPSKCCCHVGPSRASRGRARTRNVPARRPGGRRSSAHRFLGGEVA